MSDTEQVKVVKHGGIAFYTAFILCMFGSCLTLSCLVAFWQQDFLTTLQYVVTGILSGLILGALLIRGYVKSFVHELKHAMAAIAVGNKIEKFKLGDGEGHVTYKYSDVKRKFNAIISITPYVLPLFSLPVFVIVAGVGSLEQMKAILLVCIAFGLDLYANFRDVSPIQTDFTALRGGFAVGSLFTIFSNLLIGNFIIAWCFLGSAGIWDLLECSWAKLVLLVYN